MNDLAGRMLVEVRQQGRLIVKKGFILLTLVSTALWGMNSPSRAQTSKEEIVIGEQVNLYSDILDEERSLWIHLPTGYEISPGKYPVLYVLDGGAISRFSKVTGTAEGLAFGIVPRMIIVGIKNTDRERDMFPMKTEDDPTSGGGDDFLKFIAGELIPFVDKNYRTENFRILAGASNSAFFTIYALLENPKVFSAYIASSPTLLGWFENPMVKKFDDLKKKNESLNKRLFLIYGEYDFPSIIKAIPGFTRILKENAPEDFRWQVKLSKGAGHVPYSSEYEGLQFLFSDWKFPGATLKDATFQDVEAYYDQLSEKYGYKVEIPVMVLVELGNEMIKKNKTEEALEILKYNVKLYPGEPTAHFNLGLAYEAKGEIELAVQHIQKAVEIDPSWTRVKRKLDELLKKQNWITQISCS